MNRQQRRAGKIVTDAVSGARYTTEVAAHERVAQIARALAEDIFEELASRSNVFWKDWNGRRDEFVTKVSMEMIPEARNVLGKMLADPDLPQSEKDKIYMALVLDSQIPAANERSTTRVLQ